MYKGLKGRPGNQREEEGKAPLVISKEANFHMRTRGFLL